MAVSKRYSLLIVLLLTRCVAVSSFATSSFSNPYTNVAAHVGKLSDGQAPQCLVFRKVRHVALETCGRDGIGLDRIQSTRRSCRNLLRRLPVARSWVRLIRRKLVPVALALTVFLSTATAASAAVGAGRMGGSFGPSSSSSSSSSSQSTLIPRSSSWSGSSRHYGAPRVRGYSNCGPSITVYGTRPARGSSCGRDGSAVATKTTTSDLLLLIGTGALITYSFTAGSRVNSGNRRRHSVLGPGATTASITACFNVPNRNDPNSILAKLRRLSERVDTTTRKGVQNMVSEAALEVLRDERSIVSAAAHSTHYPTTNEAQREFQRMSTRKRSKFDREEVNRFGNEVSYQRRRSDSPGVDAKATKAVVTITLALEGDATRLPTVRYRRDLLDALSRIASDAKTGDCLVSAEVLWAPEGGHDVLTQNDVYADFPELVPI